MAKANPAFEAWFNHFSPFSLCQWLYFAAFCLAVLAWLGWSGPLNRTAFWLIAVTFVVHTFGLVARMYISGRPPITNLYSTAIYIGVGCRAGRHHFGSSLSASVTATCWPRSPDSHRCWSPTSFRCCLETNTGGDTIGVMQAVLDTQFWLATHVTCVVTGYAATYIAGLLGIIYVVRGVLTPSFSPRGKQRPWLE